ncbi:hypothetical protein BDL97_07G044000 [Sphagnum fallax]|nr:hypothetical protein BDL97_07G044000 [Sphagnum fallax]
MGHPVALAGVLALLSCIFAIHNWHKTPDRLPLWWDLQAHPLLYGPRWFGLLFLPVFFVLISYLLYLVSLQDSRLQSAGELSKRSADHLILFPALFLCTVQNIIILPGAKSGTDDFDANLFVLMAALWLLWFGHIVQFLEPNSVFGFITPWTSDDSNFTYTRQIGGKIVAVSAVILLIAAWFVPVGWPLLVVLLVFFFGPFVVIWGLSYGYTTSSSGADQPLLNN